MWFQFFVLLLSPKQGKYKVVLLLPNLDFKSNFVA